MCIPALSRSAVSTGVQTHRRHLDIRARAGALLLAIEYTNRRSLTYRQTLRHTIHDSAIHMSNPIRYKLLRLARPASTSQDEERNIGFPEPAIPPPALDPSTMPKHWKAGSNQSLLARIIRICFRTLCLISVGRVSLEEYWEACQPGQRNEKIWIQKRTDMVEGVETLTVV